MCGLVQLAWPVIKETTMKPTGNSNEVTKPKLTVACFAAAFLLSPVAAAIAESNGNFAHHKLAHHNGRPVLSALPQAADPPFSFACTTDGGLRPGCADGLVNR
jgi:hypothetical protein